MDMRDSHAGERRKAKAKSKQAETGPGALTVDDLRVGLAALGFRGSQFPVFLHTALDRNHDGPVW